MKNRPFVRTLLFCLILLLMMGLTGCTGFVSRNTVTTPVPGTNPVQPDTEAPESAVDRDVAALFFRFGDEPYLTCEYRTLTFSPAMSREKVILTELLAGPGSNTSGMKALFPSGTKVTAATVNGRTLFVTLTRDVLESQPDEPENWRNDLYWSIEVPLRRKLAMQSIVATVTENCDVDRVQIMLEANDNEQGSLRLPMSYFATDEADGLTSPIERDDNLILTPSVTMKVISQLRCERNWEKLYLYMASHDESTGSDLPEYREFVTRMEQLPRIAGTVIGSASVDYDGQRAVFGMQVNVLDQEGLIRDAGNSTVRLNRENGIWKITMSQLCSWPEE